MRMGDEDGPLPVASESKAAGVCVEHVELWVIDGALFSFGK